MQEYGAPAKFFGRFDRGNRVSQRRQASRIASSARADIENPAGSGRDQVHDKTMGIGKRDGLVALEQLWRLLGVVLSAADPDRSHPKPRKAASLSAIVEGGAGITEHRRYRFSCFAAGPPNNEPIQSQAASSCSSQVGAGGP